jgi:hypothetical protein
VEWIQLARERDRQRAVVNVVITSGLWHHGMSELVS